MRPSFRIFTKRESRTEGRAFWLEVGSAWPNGDGSFRIELSALPVDGKLIMRPARPADEDPDDPA